MNQCFEFIQKISRLRFLLLVFIQFGVLTNIKSQTVQEPFRKYTTQAYNNWLLNNDALYAARLASMEDSIALFLLSDKIEKRTVRVVFHILESPGMPYISDSTLLHQLAQLNTDFNTLTFNPIHYDSCVSLFVEKALVPQIEFCLASTLDSTKIKYQIKRRSTNVAIFDSYPAIKSTVLGGSDPILSEHCLNIWICNLPESEVGFAQYPGGPQSSDGIVMSYKYLIPPQINGKRDPVYNLGKPLTHLVGGYLGVYELWNEAIHCADDFVEDTPISNEPNHGFEMTFCGHYTTCHQYTKEMIINFMDNVTDSLSVMFTKGQVYRMHAVLASPSYRKSLWSLSPSCTDFVIPDTTHGSVTDTGTFDMKFSIRPNPASADLYVDVEQSKKTPLDVYIFDTTGKRILSGHWEENINKFSKKIDVSGLFNGLYFIRIDSNEGSHSEAITVLRY